MNVGLAGEFKWEVRKVKDDSLVSSEDWQPNLILDQCFTEAAKNYYLSSYILLGTGGTAPKITDTQLENEFRNWSTRNQVIADNVEKWNFPSKNIIVSVWTIVRRFRPMTSVNLAELGLEMDSHKLATRTLFKNTSGPTTVTVLPDEYIDIYYRIWGRYDTTKITTAIPYKKKSRGSDLESETWNVESKIVFQKTVNVYDTFVPSLRVTWNNFIIGWITERVDLDATTDIGIYSSNFIYKPASPEGTMKRDDITSHISYTGEYSGGTLTLKGSYDSGVSFSTGTYKALLYHVPFLCFVVNLPDSKEIVKTNSQSLQFELEIKVTRYTGSLSDLKEGTSYAP